MTRLLIYQCHLPFANFHLTASLWRAAREMFGVEVEVAQPFAVGHHLRRFRPDVVLAFGGESLTADGVRALRPLAAEAAWVLWTTEDPFELEVNVAAASAFDQVFTSDAGSVSAYRHPRAAWLPLAGDEAFFFQPVRDDPDELWYDLLFVGTAWPNRVAFLTDLIRAARDGGLRTRFILPSNEFLSSEALDALGVARWERDYRVSPRDLSLLQNRSRFTLSLFRDFSRFGDRPRPQTSPTNRFYETALTGTAQLLVAPGFAVESFYPGLGDAAPALQTVPEVLARVAAARRDPAARNAAARRAQDFVRAGHLYRHRLEEVLRHIRGE